MRFEILGPLRVLHRGEQVRLGGPREAKVLGALLIASGRRITLGRIAEAVWQDHPPATWQAQLNNAVAMLRGALAGAAAITRSGSSLHLSIDDCEFDLHEFQELAAQAAACRDPARAARLYRDALGLWRGPVLDGLTGGPVLAGEVRRIEEQGMLCLERRVGADLAAGRPAELIGELAALIERYPSREALLHMYLLALYRAGRREEALDGYARARRRIVTETGLDPGPELTELHRAMLRADPALRGPSFLDDEHAEVGTAAPAQLPSDLPDFVGRDAELSGLDALLPSGPSIAVITGPGGVGKTATAVHWAWRRREDFPDGQLYADLHGFSSSPPEQPLRVLARFLRALGVRDGQIPTAIEEATALYRTMLADRRVLVLLDNAVGAEQARPLLPAGPGNLALVTSRDRLTGLVVQDGARRVRLDVFARAEAIQLLTRIIGAEPVRQEAQATEQLAERCGRLPLALRIAAANLADEADAAGEAIDGYVRRMSGPQTLASLAVEGEGQLSVQAAFELSYARVNPAARRLFRLLSGFPGPDFTAQDAAAMAGADTTTAAGLLQRLAGVHLLHRQGAGRYAFHDLLRLYAEDKSALEDSARERSEALVRLHSHYLAMVGAAARALYPEKLRLPARHPATETMDHATALAWLDAERTSLVAAVTSAAGRDLWPIAWQLSDALRGYFFLRMHAVDWLSVARAGLAAAEAGGDLNAQAAAHLSLADVHRRRGLYPDAIEHLNRALELARAGGWKDCEAVALGNLGNAYAEAGMPREAAAQFRQALRMDRRAAGTAVTLGNLGLVSFEMGRLREAIRHLDRALALHREAGARYAEAVVLESLGEVHCALGNHVLAEQNLLPALRLHRELGDRGAEAETLRILAGLLAENGRGDDALEHAKTALRLSVQTGESRVQAGAWNALGFVHIGRSEPDEALASHLNAMEVARLGFHRYAEVEALLGAATVRQTLGEPDRPGVVRALTIAREAGFRLLEADALLRLAEICAAEGDPAEAAGLAHTALEIHRKAGHRRGRMRAEHVLETAARTHAT